MKKLKQLNQNWCLTLIFSDCIRYVKPREQFSLHEPALLMMASILLVKYKYSALETFVITALYKSTFTIPCHLLLLRICFIALLCLYCLLQTVQMHYVFACSDALVCAYVHQVMKIDYHRLIVGTVRDSLSPIVSWQFCDCLMTTRCSPLGCRYWSFTSHFQSRFERMLRLTVLTWVLLCWAEWDGAMQPQQRRQTA